MARSLLVAAAAALLVSACGTLPAPELPARVPPAWRQQPAATATAGDAPAPDLQGWWKALGDPALDALVERALQQNIGLAQATSRLRQARLLSGRDRAQWKPALAAEARTVQDAAAVDSYYHVGIDASWELGLFGLRSGVVRATQSRVDHALADEQGVRVALVAEVVRRYLVLGAARQEEAALQRLLALDMQALALHAQRRRLQLGAPDETHAAALRQAQLQALLATPRQAAAAAAQALAALLAGTEPPPEAAPAAQRPAPAVQSAATAAQGAAPALPYFALQQVPADLLRVRPDIRGAEAQVGQAAGELGMARAELYPRIVIGASYLYSYNITQNRRTLHASVPSLGPSIDIPLFDWGRRRANADAQEEALNAALLAYRQAVVDAVAETETALSALAQARARAAALAGAQDLAAAQARLQATRVGLGLAAPLERLEAERAALQAAQEAGAAQWACAQAFVGVYKALGGAPLGEFGNPTGGGGGSNSDGSGSGNSESEGNSRDSDSDSNGNGNSNSNSNSSNGSRQHSRANSGAGGAIGAQP